MRLRQRVFAAGPNAAGKELVEHEGRAILRRPDKDDERDPERLRQTHLEGVNTNKHFRDIYHFFNGEFEIAVPNAGEWATDDGNAGAPRDLLVAIATARDLPLAKLLPFEGRSLRALYTEGFCGGAVIPLGDLGRPANDVHVPLAHQSALAGVLLAAAGV